MRKTDNKMFRGLRILTILITSVTGLSAHTYAQVKDTVMGIRIEELVVVDSPKESRTLANQPVSYTTISKEVMENERVFSMKQLTAIVPNLYIPNYGTKLTSSIYIRGIGSRVNSSAAGVYVDGTPYYDKSAFDFDYADIQAIEVLRGPQGTLYGRNSMGGLLNIHTKSPFNYTGTDFSFSAATKNAYRVSLTHYHRISDKLAWSAGGFADHKGGFYKNLYTGKNIDKGTSGGGRLHYIYLPAKRWKLDLNIYYEYNDDGGYPYGAYNKATGEYSQPNYNFKGGYVRNLLNGGLTAVYKGDGFTFTSVTGYQRVRDRLSMDTDYTPADRFTMVQKQRQTNLNEEITFKGRVGVRGRLLGSIDWTTGATAYYQWLTNNAPLTFGSDFIADLQRRMDAAMAQAPVKVKLTDERMEVPGLFKTPTFGSALFHQSVLGNLAGIKGLSATLGLRIDYEKVKIDYNTGSQMNYQTYRGTAVVGEGKYTVQYLGRQSESFSPLLPRLALKYDFGGARNSGGSNGGNVYALMSRGYRGGGYNIQMLSDYMQADLQKNTGILENDENINNALRYKPEFSWNYEVGGHLFFLDKRLQADVSLFFMRIKNQQVSRFAESGMGRYTSNAGRSLSRGVELSLSAFITGNWLVRADYGYTHAKFTKYETNVRVYDSRGQVTLQTIDYKNKRVPFAPHNTLHLSMVYSFDLGKGGADKLSIGADYTGVGKVYFTEANDVKQNYYSLVNTRLTYSYNNPSGGYRTNSFFMGFEISVWAANIFNKKYALFYFDSGSAGFMQRGRGPQGGIDLRLKF